MLDFNKIKFALFGFDDTLCIHTNHALDDGLDCLKTLEDGVHCWNDCVPSNHMREFMLKCKYRGIKLGLVAACNFYPRAVDECTWVHENYGVKLENYCVSKHEYKVKALHAIAVANNLKPYEILIVDDLYSTLDTCSDMGYQACSPLEIINYLEKVKA